MNFLHAGNKRIVDESGSPVLLRGFGLGGWLLPEGYMWKLYQKCDRPRRMEALIEELCGSDFSAAFWPKYFSGYITERDIEYISSQGMNCVRLPLNARHLQECLCYVDEVISWCRSRNIYVVLDMHAAPGGQTGSNIDDSADDVPRLFLNDEYREALVLMWTFLAKRYADEPTVAGYDLLNEPLPEWFSAYNGKLMPLYRELISVIRTVDKRHMLILEGVHWASDWSVFDELESGLPDNNILLQFHKYWSPPDPEGIARYTHMRDTLDLPIFMGEGGENNCNWYTGFFPMLEEQNISWNFWSYKKMDCDNSPVTFSVPDGWDELIGYLDGGNAPEKERAQNIFTDFLDKIVNHTRVNQDVCNALKRESPVSIPAEYFSSCHMVFDRKAGAVFRTSTPASILFRNGDVGRAPEYKYYAGEPQLESELLCVRLCKGEWLEYVFYAPSRREYTIGIRYQSRSGALLSALDTGQSIECEKKENGCLAYTVCEPGRHTLRVCCESGEALVEEISIR